MSSIGMGVPACAAGRYTRGIAQAGSTKSVSGAAARSAYTDAAPGAASA